MQKAMVYKTLLACCLSSSAVVGFTALEASAGIVQRISVKQAMTGKAPRINVCAKGGGFNLSLLGIEGNISGGWFDDKSRATLAFNTNIKDTPAKIAHLRRIDTLEFPGEIPTETTLLSMYTTDGKLYRFEIGYDCPSPYDTGILVDDGSAQIAEAEAPAKPKSLKDRLKAKKAEANDGSGKGRATKSAKDKSSTTNDDEWVIPSNRFLIKESSWQPYKTSQAKEVEARAVDVPVVTQPVGVEPAGVQTKFNAPVVIPVSPAPNNYAKQEIILNQVPVESNEAEQQIQLTPETLGDPAIVAQKPASTFLGSSGMPNSEIAYYLNKGLHQANLKGEINYGTTAYRRWGSVIKLVRGGTDLESAIARVRGTNAKTASVLLRYGNMP